MSFFVQNWLNTNEEISNYIAKNDIWVITEDDNKQLLQERQEQGYLNLGINDFLDNKNVTMKVFAREISNKDFRLQTEIYNTWTPFEIIKEITFIKAVDYNEPMPKEKTVKLAHKSNWKYNGNTD